MRDSENDIPCIKSGPKQKKHLAQRSSNTNTPKNMRPYTWKNHLNGSLKAEYCKHKVFAYKRLAALA